MVELFAPVIRIEVYQFNWDTVTQFVKLRYDEVIMAQFSKLRYNDVIIAQFSKLRYSEVYNAI